MERAKSSAARIAIILLYIAGCTEKEIPSTIPADFTPYVQRFVEEGSKRGVNVDISKLNVEFVNSVTINGLAYCGQSVAGSTPHVQIVNTDYCWKTQTDLNKEILLFHELGHALLRRSHDSGLLPNGSYRSMMFDGNQFGLYTQYTPELRQYYLDELFNSAMPVPSWGAAKTNSADFYSDIITGSDWSYVFSSNATTLAHTGAVSTTVYASASRSLSIQSATATGSDQFSMWYHVLSPSGLPVGSSLTLKVKVRTDNLVGGASIAIRGDSGTEVGFFTTSQGRYEIKGTQDFTEFAVTAPYVPGQLDRIVIYLILFGQSTGTIYFDDVKLVNNY